MVRAILKYAPPLDATDDRFHGTPADWADHGATGSSSRASGDYPATVRALADADNAQHRSDGARG